MAFISRETTMEKEGINAWEAQSSYTNFWTWRLLLEKT